MLSKGLHFASESTALAFRVPDQRVSVFTAARGLLRGSGRQNREAAPRFTSSAEQGHGSTATSG
jgi:hypothetical protein